jgi:hypothetical protein
VSSTGFSRAVACCLSSAANSRLAIAGELKKIPEEQRIKVYLTSLVIKVGRFKFRSSKK